MSNAMPKHGTGVKDKQKEAMSMVEVIVQNQDGTRQSQHSCNVDVRVQAASVAVHDSKTVLAERWVVNCSKTL